MRKRIGWWLLVLGSLAAPGAAGAQELQRWCASPLGGTPPAAAPAAGTGLDLFCKWCDPAPEAPAPAPRVPYTVRGQDLQGYYVPPELYVGPLSHPRYEDGGFYCGFEFLYFRETRPLNNQTIAIRGYLDTNGTVSQQLGTFVGSGETALDTSMLRGPGTWQPGTNTFFGWRFANGVAVEIGWWHLQMSRYTATAGVIPPSLNFGTFNENTFLFSPVTNFPIFYGGNNANILISGGPANGATFGIWNAASEEEISFRQRFELVQLNARLPIWDGDRYRAYGVFGPRAIIMWEEFAWRTVDRDALTGIALNDTTAIYNNISSNRLYGFYCGSGHDWYLGSTPIGGFSVDLSFAGGLYWDFVKGRARYELGDKSSAATRSRNMSTIVPEVEGKIGLVWYPWEAIQVRFGYNFMALFNTVGSRYPVDFNFGTLDPRWDTGITRLLQGADFGIAFVF
jgi:hypothetical protein